MRGPSFAGERTRDTASYANSISPQRLALGMTGRQLPLAHDDGTVLARPTVQTSSQRRRTARPATAR